MTCRTFCTGHAFCAILHGRSITRMHMMGITVESDSLPPEDQREARELEALYRISQLLATVSNQRQMLGEVLDVLDGELGLERGTIMLLSPTGSEVRLEVAHGMADH